jgi:ATP-dependent RNA circularization protein (DNA/RNA ligase family)
MYLRNLRLFTGNELTRVVESIENIAEGKKEYEEKSIALTSIDTWNDRFCEYVQNILIALDISIWESSYAYDW